MVKSEFDFSKNKSRPDGLAFYCRKCRSEYSQIPEHKSKKSEYGKMWTRKNKDRLNRLRREKAKSSIDFEKNRQLIKTYGITLADKKDMMTSQNGACAICGEEFRNGKDTHIDHNHSTGRVRGVLCSRCNFALGLIKDNKDIALNMADYLSTDEQQSNY